MSKPESHDVKKIISYWGLTAHKWEKIKDVYKVKTNQGIKNLKVSPLNLKRLTFVHGAINHLVQQGFQKMVPLIPTTSGTTYICHSGKAFSLFDWIDGNQSNFSNLNELKTAGRILAEFHRRSTGFTPPEGSNMRNQIGKALEHFEHRHAQLLEYSEIARHSPDDPFAQLYLTNLPYYLPMAEKAILKLKNSNYQQLVYQAQSQQGFCHGDPAARNFITTPRSQMFMIDFDSCRLDLAIMDLIKFTRRVMKKYNWSYPIAKFLIDAYQEVSPLNQSELEVMKAVFYFPQKFWRLANRHFEQHNRYTPEREIGKFKNYLTHKQQLMQFETDFDYYQ